MLTIPLLCIHFQTSVLLTPWSALSLEVNKLIKQMISFIYTKTLPKPHELCVWHTDRWANINQGGYSM
jgi:hypothetical protein